VTGSMHKRSGQWTAAPMSDIRPGFGVGRAAGRLPLRTVMPVDWRVARQVPASSAEDPWQ